MTFSNKSSRNKVLQGIWHKYSEATGYQPSSARQVAEWAVKAGLILPPKVDPIDKLANDMARALRGETAIDADGK